MLESLNDWTLAVENKKCVDVLYLDFAKAFDRVSHAKLIHKLHKLSFNQMIIRWITEFLSGRSFQVRVGDAFSETRNVTSGVPQGGVLSPTLFSIYTLEVPQLGSDLDVITKVYADDTKLYQVFKPDDAIVLQEALLRVIRWSIEWQLPLAADKTQVFHIGKDNPEQDYFVEGKELISVELVRDLGFHITKNLSFDTHIKNIVQQAKTACCTIFRAVKTRNRSALVRAYKCYVRPIVESATTIFSPTMLKNLKSLESVQGKFTKWLYIREKNYTGPTIPSQKLRNHIYGLNSLACRRLRSDLKMVYCVMNGLNGLNVETFFQMRPSCTRGYSRKLVLPRVQAKVRRSFFVNRAAAEYRNIEKEGIVFKSLKDFLSYLKGKYNF
jgi:hypothetical protein